ncbi:MAG TPA: glycosyltransferase [Bacteroidota bacterium]|nr:glycosyltransferase [Bacteroidota bacterium]
MNVCVVIVTYGNRYRFLERVIDSLVTSGISRIIVVDNNSETESRKQLQKKEEDLKRILKVIHLKENLGSAGGYKCGLVAAQAENDCEYIWLLDDDNVPRPQALGILEDFWKNYPMNNKENKLCLLSYRISSPAYKELARLDSSSIEPILGSRNAALGLNIFRLRQTRYNSRLFRSFFKDDEIILNKHYGRIPVAPYGGMFFNKQILNIIGYPNEELFLYGDDYEFSYRIIQHQGEIILVLDSIVDDIDVSENKGMSVNNDNLFRLYYTNRNYLYFQKSLSNNKKIFMLNYFVYCTFLRIKRAFHFLFKDADPMKISILLNAFEDANTGRLGKQDKRIYLSSN